jgi:hypothetical protein
MKKSLFLLIMIPFMMGTINSTAQGTWTRKADMLGNARYNLLGFTDGNNGYITGGTFGGLTVTSDCQEFDPVSNAWTGMAPMPYAFRAGAAFGLSGRGYTGVNEAMFIQELLEYNILGDNWSILNPFPGVVRMYASAFGIGHKGFITCGSYINIEPLNDLWEWDQQSNLWTQKANLPGSARANATAFSVGLKAYVWWNRRFRCI